MLTELQCISVALSPQSQVPAVMAPAPLHVNASCRSSGLGSDCNAQCTSR